MKPSTMLQYLGDRAATIAIGWTSGAAFEGYVQVILDDIARTHLSNRIRIYSNDTTGEKVLTQGLLKSGQVVAKNAWPKMREIAYPNSSQIVDEYIANRRWTIGKGEHANTAIFKNTYHWIELKAESPVNGKFGGASAKNSYDTDLAKLGELKFAESLLDQPSGVTRRRYWFIMIAFSTEKRAEVASYTWTVSGTFVTDTSSMFVGILEL